MIEILLKKACSDLKNLSLLLKEIEHSLIKENADMEHIKKVWNSENKLYDLIIAVKNLKKKIGHTDGSF